MTVITKKTSKKEIARMLKVKPAKKKVMDMKKISGKLSWKGDALEIQREMRNDR
jgi:hypothetical protein